jgi:Tfp pilus assembly major pilin PilA
MPHSSDNEIDKAAISLINLHNDILSHHEYVKICMIRYKDITDDSRLPYQLKRLRSLGLKNTILKNKLVKRANATRATAKRTTAKRTTAKRATAKRTTAKRATAKRITAKRINTKHIVKTPTVNHTSLECGTLECGTLERDALECGTLERDALERDALEPKSYNVILGGCKACGTENTPQKRIIFTETRHVAVCNACWFAAVRRGFCKKCFWIPPTFKKIYRDYDRCDRCDSVDLCFNSQHKQKK